MSSRLVDLQEQEVAWLAQEYGVADCSQLQLPIEGQHDLPVKTVAIGCSPLHPDLDILSHGTISTAPVRISWFLLLTSSTYGTSARIRSNSRVLPPPRLILGSRAVDVSTFNCQCDCYPQASQFVTISPLLGILPVWWTSMCVRL